MSALADFFGVPRKAIQIECPQHSFELTHHNKDQELSVCLHRTAKRKRCEIVIKTFEKSPHINHVSFEAKTNHNINHPTEWVGLMQIHAFPDVGEKWRCPPFSLETHRNRLRMYNRWDTQKISKTTGYNCAQKGNSIQSRTVFGNYPIQQNEWFSLDMDLKLSHRDDAQTNVILDQGAPISMKGPNIYNDHKMPYLKFGIYKPTSWERGHLMSCVTYRKMDISVKR